MPAEAALQTLSELGYARTSVRDELITHCGRQYKAKCVTRYDQILLTSVTASALELGHGLVLGATLR